MAPLAAEFRPLRREVIAGGPRSAAPRPRPERAADGLPEASPPRTRRLVLPVHARHAAFSRR